MTCVIDVRASCAQTCVRSHGESHESEMSTTCVVIRVSW